MKNTMGNEEEVRPCVLITAAGEFLPQRPALSAEFTLEELQKFVGGYVEIIHTRHGMCMVLDEEGKLKEKSVNVAASDIARGVIMADDVVVGDVLYCHPSFVGIRR